MKIKHFLQFITLFFGIFTSLSVRAETISEQEAQNWAQNKGNEILQILTSENIEEKYSQLDEILAKDVDLDYAAKFVAGRYWKQMSEEQRQQHVNLFKRYTSSLYKTYPITIEQGDVTFTVDKVTSGKNMTNVHCTIYIKQLENKADNSSKGGFKATFVLTKTDDHIKVRDLKIEESSFLISYRERFYQMIHDENDDDIDWYLEDLEMRIEDSETQNTKK